jgi:hypothetical protein
MIISDLRFAVHEKEGIHVSRVWFAFTLVMQYDLLNFCLIGIIVVNT